MNLNNKLSIITTTMMDKQQIEKLYLQEEIERLKNTLYDVKKDNDRLIDTIERNEEDIEKLQLTIMDLQLKSLSDAPITF